MFKYLAKCKYISYYDFKLEQVTRARFEEDDDIEIVLCALRFDYCW